jgi:hypothetical protein
MSGLTVVLLFSKDQSKEPPAILQCSVSGEYLNYSFDDWRDAVHYLFWCSYNKFNPQNDSNFDTWRATYGYQEEEQFVGDRNEFINQPVKVIVFTSFSLFSNNVDLARFSVWTSEAT